MTTKEAIFELIKYRRRLEKDSTIDAEPFDMAIRSLEAWDEVDYLVNKTYWGFPVGLDYCLDMLTEIMKEVEDGEDGE